MKNIIILFFTITLLFSCKNKPQHLVKIEGKQLPVTENIYSNKTIEEIIIPYNFFHNDECLFSRRGLTQS